jgi:DNA-binding beta-propeller fold protein YncE
MLPLPVEVSYPPHYLFSIYGVAEPVGVTLSPQGDRIYVAERGGERLVKMFDADGDALGSFAPPRTEPGQRSPVYLDANPTGQLFVTDRLQHAIFVYNLNGGYLDTILGPDLTLSEYISSQVDAIHPSDRFGYNLFQPAVYYQKIGQFGQILSPPARTGWAPLGVRVDAFGRLLVTDARAGLNTVRVLPSDFTPASFWPQFDPAGVTVGTNGRGDGQLIFPNSAVTDSQGRIYITDSNNSRISVWSNDGRFLFQFGQGKVDEVLSLPRGAAITPRDHLHVVDAVGQNVKVYDVSGPEPRFLFTFGSWGMGDGQFNYPNDIALDNFGRLYIADRENNRVQVWAY